jgi:DNA-binding transcriptional ArsR family regulator
MTVGSVFEALADPTRRAVVETLSHRPHRAGELARKVGVSPQALSRHLRVLRASDLVDGHQSNDDYRVRIYALRQERLEDLRSWLEDMRGFWADQLVSLQKEVEEG